MEPSGESARVLVVDDNAENRALAEATLEDEGFTVILAKTGEEGLEAYEKHRPDCILLDVRMPGLDGFAVCDRIRATPEGGDVPIIFLTALRDVDTFEHALSAGANDFLTKPVRPAELCGRVRAALRLRRVSTELKDVYEVVRRQRDDLMRLQLYKEQLMQFVVHDLKNPVNAIDLHAQVLARKRDLPESALASVRAIRQETRSLMRLVLNLLDIGKADEGRLVPELKRVDLADLVEGARQALEAAAQQQQIGLSVDDVGGELTCDPDLVRRTLENLLDNAIRHTPQGGRVQVSASREGERLQLRVSDSGKGIPESMRERIFERFVQVEDASVGTRPGRGLGLAFCKMVAEAHGGRIWVEDGAPGAVFCIELPHA